MKYRLLIVERPEGWQPKDWDEVPLFFVIHEHQDELVSKSRSVGAMFGFNSAALHAKDCRLWMVRLPASRMMKD